MLTFKFEIVMIRNLIPPMFFVIFLTACSTGEQPNQKKTVFDIESTKTKEHKRIPKSKVFAVIPETYKFESEGNIHRKSAQQYFTVAEVVNMQNLNLSAIKLEKIIRKGIEQQAGDVSIYKKIKVNNYSGIYFEGGFAEHNAASVGVWFGNASFSVFFTGVYPAGDAQEKIDLLSILSSLYYDEKFRVSPNEFKDFTFDAAISGFKFNKVNGARLFYTPTGKETNLYKLEAYLSFSSGAIQSELEGEVALRNLLLNMSNAGVTCESKDYKRIKLAGRTALLLESKMKEKEHQQFLYLVLIIGSKKSVLMYGMCNLDRLKSPDQLDKYRDIFYRTAASIKF